MKDVSDSPRLVYFVTRLVNSVLKLPDGQVKFFLGEFFWGIQINFRRTVINPPHQNSFQAS